VYSLRPFSLRLRFNFLFQFTPLFDLRSVIFGLTHFGWLHTRTRQRMYGTHGTEQNWEVTRSLHTVSPCAIRLVQTVQFGCIYLNLSPLPPPPVQTPRGRTQSKNRKKLTRRRIIVAVILLAAMCVICGQ
jgi:hypothetical protein